MLVTDMNHVFSVRLVVIDYAMASPLPGMDECYSRFHSRGVARVPVVRIFGATLSGQKTCVHIHKSFPYFYVPYDQDLPQDVDSANDYIRRLAVSLEEALNSARDRVMTQQHIQSCSLVQAIPFYGYHPKRQIFIKIVLYYPHEISRAASILQGGAIMGRPFQPFESHVPFLLQFMIDNNLHGMSLLNASKVRFRNPLPEPQGQLDPLTNALLQLEEGFRKGVPELDFSSPGMETPPGSPSGGARDPLETPVKSGKIPGSFSGPGGGLAPCHGRYSSASVPPEWVLPWRVRRQSVCELEADISVEDILNRGDVVYTPLEDAPPDMRMVPSLAPLWEDEKERTGCTPPPPPPEPARKLPPPTEQELTLRRAVDSLVASNPRVAGPSDWPSDDLASLSQPANLSVPVEPGRGFFPEPGPIQESQVDKVKLSQLKEGDEEMSQQQGRELLGIIRWLEGGDDPGVEPSLDSREDLYPGSQRTAAEMTAGDRGLSVALDHARRQLEEATQREIADIIDGDEDPLRWHIPQSDGADDDMADRRKRKRVGNSSHGYRQKLTDFMGILNGPRPKRNHCDGSVRDMMRRQRSRSRTIQEASGHVLAPCSEAAAKEGGPERGSFQETSGAGHAPSCRDAVRESGGGSGSFQEASNHIEAPCRDTAAKEEDAYSGSFQEASGQVMAPSREPSVAEESAGREILQEVSGCGMKPDSKAATMEADSGGRSFQEGSAHAAAPCSEATAEQQGTDGKGSFQEGPGRVVRWHVGPPSMAALAGSWDSFGMPPVKVPEVFYGDQRDALGRSVVIGGKEFSVPARDSTVHLSPFLLGDGSIPTSHPPFSLPQPSGDPPKCLPSVVHPNGTFTVIITPAQPPPSRSSVVEWIGKQPSAQLAAAGDITFGSTSSDSSPTLNLPEEAETQSWQRPASPKYDESHVLSTPLFSPVPKSRPEPPPRPLMGPPRLPAGKAAAPAPPGAPKGSNDRWRDVSQITAPSLVNNTSTAVSQMGFKVGARSGVQASDQMTTLSIEVHASSRGNLTPDPRLDPLACVALCFQNVPHGAHRSSVALLLDESVGSQGPKRKMKDGLSGYPTLYFSSEAAIIAAFLALVRACNPDILVGWEVQLASLGFLCDRAAHLGIGLIKSLSRTPPDPRNTPTFFSPPAQNAETRQNSDSDTQKCASKFGDVFADFSAVGTPPAGVETAARDPGTGDEWGRTHGSGIHVTGRIVLNLWRIMRDEVKLSEYSMEAVAEAVLRKRVPRFTWRQLSEWYSSGQGGSRWRCVDHFVRRADLNLCIIEQMDIINRTSELARVFGIDFFSVMNRGSQFRVESMMIRLCRTQNMLPISPSRLQVAQQPAMQCLPLVMEPESRLYTSPVLVLDFQSLYPSMVIAYNLCFSTCMGRITRDNPKRLGVSQYDVPDGLLPALSHGLQVMPNGVLYVGPRTRRGVLPRLLSEILGTRVMVKGAMKGVPPSQKALHRILNARQFALKLIANVTYGYTAAGFSGRMPCAELADSIVQMGRQTLERAIAHVNATKKWGGRVVYGDTDSLFVVLEGRTREEAFAIGQEIAASVTAMNPPPVALKFEKVYSPCVLLTKKRYVGYAFDSASQATPTFDAKGIETVRRDGCPALAKSMERSLRILFETLDLSQVKAYLQRQWTKVLSDRVSIRDFVFAKEVRLGSYSTSRGAVLPPGAIVATKAMARDPRAEPRYGERVPYVVVYGEPGARLVDLVVDPQEVVAPDSTLRLHGTYYITKQIIPAIQRVLGLVGADLRAWWAETPKVLRLPVRKRQVAGAAMAGPSIEGFYLSRHCVVCGGMVKGSESLCSGCAAEPQVVVSVLARRAAGLEAQWKHLVQVCRHCGGGDREAFGGVSIVCVSLHCPVYFERSKVWREGSASKRLLPCLELF